MFLPREVIFYSTFAETFYTYSCFKYQMKKLFSIVFAVMILLSGMHLSLASHYCGGELAAVKLSVDDAKATCGMQATDKYASAGTSFTAESCCKDEISDYTVDNNYNPSSLQVNEPIVQLLQVFYIPEIIGCPAVSTTFSHNTNVRQPGYFIASAVSLPDICVFLI